MQTELRDPSGQVFSLPSQTLAAATVSKIPQVVNLRVYIPMSTTAIGEQVSLVYRADITADKAAAQAWAMGVALYWDNAAKNFTTTAAGNTLCGHASAAALSADTRGRILFDSFAIA